MKPARANLCVMVFLAFMVGVVAGMGVLIWRL
jgi:hypothetical protein